MTTDEALDEEIRKRLLHEMLLLAFSAGAEHALLGSVDCGEDIEEAFNEWEKDKLGDAIS